MTQLLALSLLGCNPGPMAAPDGYTVWVPEDETFGMDAGFVTPGDGIGLLSLATIKVRDAEDYSANGIAVEVVSGWTGAYIVPEEVVTVVSSYEEACEAAPTDTCSAYFDEDGVYYELSGNYEGGDDYRPTYYFGETDRSGNLRIYILVDSVPIDSDGNPVGFRIYAEIASDSDSWSLDPIGASAD